MHAQDAFARRYMAGIGHFDFGDNLKPVDFDGWARGGGAPAADGLEFWIRYWCAAYRALLEAAQHDRVHLVGFEALGERRCNSEVWWGWSNVPGPPGQKNRKRIVLRTAIKHRTRRNMGSKPNSDEIFNSEILFSEVIIL